MKLQAPLLTLRQWYAEQPAQITEKLPAFVVNHLGVSDPRKSVTESFERLLNDEPSHPVPLVGRVICTCGLIDYMMEEWGHPAKWNRELDNQLDMIEAAGEASAEEKVEAGLADFSANRDAWIAAAERWWELRSAALHHDAIRQWEEAQRASEAAVSQ
jgi:hypothetical protein